MLLPQHQTALSPDGEIPSSARLRLRAGSQTVELPLGKTTIGSSPRCNLRIQQPEVHPLHCLISREPGSLSARRWAGEARLNGEAFDEAPLAAGDRLRIGSVEVEIVALAPVTPPTELRTAAAPDPDAAGRLRAGRDLARRRSRQLLATLRRSRTDHLELSGRVTDLQQQIGRAVAERQSNLGDLQKTVAELANARQQVMEQAALVAAGQGLAAQNEQFGREVSELTRRIEQLTRELASSAAERETLAEEKAALADEVRRLADEANQLRRQSSELTDQHTAVCGERDELRRQNEQLNSDLHVLATEKAALAVERTALRDERDTFRQQNERLQSDFDILAKENATLAEGHTVLCGERDQLRGQNERLQSELNVLADEKVVLAEQRTELYGERDQLRQQIEQVRSELDSLANQRVALANEHAVLCGERDGFRQQFERLQKELDALASEKTVLADDRATLRTERDELFGQNEQLRSDLHALAEQKTALADERAILCDQRDELGRQIERFQANIYALSEEKAALADDRASLVSERDRLLLEANRVSSLEHQVREAVADRENTSSELYRALLQLAEMQTRDDQHEALVADHQALNEKLEKSAAEAAELQAQLDRLAAERTSAESDRQALVEKSSELSAAQKRLADENAELLASLAEARQQVDEALLQQAEYAERLENAETLQQKLDEAEVNQAAFSQTVARLEGEIAHKLHAEAAAEAMLADHNRQMANQTRQLAESAETVRRLEQQLAAAEQVGSTLAQARDEWERLGSEAAGQEADQSQRIAELEAELAAALAAAAPAAFENPAAETSPPGERAVEVGSDLAARFDKYPSAEADWSSVLTRPQSLDARPSESEANAIGEAAISKSANGDSPWGHAPQEPTLNQAASPESQETPPASFIDGYSHMFAEEESSAGAIDDLPPPAPVGELRTAEPSIPQKPRNNGVTGSSVSPSPSGDDDEESIEQYMAKLLQRVRGDGPRLPASQSPPSTDVTNEGPLSQGVMTLLQPATAAQIAEPSEPARGPLSVTGNEAQTGPGSWMTRPSSAIPAQTTDLGALRALANETARRAISTHALRKHRRNAVTKVIVATLAGMTSLWLMLQSPSWWDLQFIAACVSLLVAAYWAGQTYRALIESLHIPSYDGLDEESGGSKPKFDSPLPIDVENGR